MAAGLHSFSKALEGPSDSRKSIALSVPAPRGPTSFGLLPLPPSSENHLPLSLSSVFLAVLEFELRALYLLDKHSATTPAALFALVLFEVES
jgi:hypothetical protein